MKVQITYLYFCHNQKLKIKKISKHTWLNFGLFLVWRLNHYSEVIRDWSIDQLIDWLTDFTDWLFGAFDSPATIFHWGLKEWEEFVSVLWSAGFVGLLQVCLQKPGFFLLWKWIHHWPVEQRQNHYCERVQNLCPFLSCARVREYLICRNQYWSFNSRQWNAHWLQVHVQ